MKYRNKILLLNSCLIAFLIAVAAGLYVVFAQKSSDPTLSDGVVRRTNNLYGSITEVNGARLHEMREGHIHFFVYFYAPWCAKCVDFLEEYNTLAESITQEVHLRNRKLASSGFQYDEVVFTFLNCEENAVVCREEDLHIDHYPTITAFNFNYKGEVCRIFYNLADFTGHSDLEALHAVEEHQAGASGAQRAGH